MRKTALLTIILLSLTLVVPGIRAEEEDNVIDATMEACKPEIKSYCSQVTIGEGRLLACFYAHGDKISGRCEYALYNAAAQLEEFATALTHLARQCHDDLLKHCGEVEVGEGRVGSCLLEHKEHLVDACRKAIDDVGLEAAE